MLNLRRVSKVRTNTLLEPFCLYDHLGSLEKPTTYSLIVTILSTTSSYDSKGQKEIVLFPTAS